MAGLAICRTFGRAVLSPVPALFFQVGKLLFTHPPHSVPPMLVAGTRTLVGVS